MKKPYSFDWKQQNFIRILISKKEEYTFREIDLRTNQLGLSDMKAPLLVVVFNCDFENVDFSFKDDLLESIFFDISDLCNKIGWNCGYVDEYERIKILISLFNQDDVIEIIRHSFVEIIKYIESKYTIKMVVGIGNIVDNIAFVGDSAYNAESQLKYVHLYGKSGIICANDIVPFQQISILSDHPVFERVINAFTEGNVKELILRLNEFVAFVRTKPNVSKTGIKRNLAELMIRLLNIAADVDDNVDSVLDGRDPYKWIMQQNHTEIILEWILSISKELMQLMHTNIKIPNEDTIHSITRYIQEQYGNEELDLSMISGYVKMTPAYVSRYFKQTTGVGISSYIAQIRIEQAKNLLISTNLKSNEIGNLCGFSSSSYFNYVFKKKTGNSPSLYRKRYKG